ncbi:MAG: Lipoprotein LpqB, beta-propeller domain-like protein [Frankiales bacterium]|nr:Lipoprotein LpqB, beta-propeller domain-like protein [Frankiales bacterium]
MSTRSRRLLATACMLLAAGCGLPLAGGVQKPGPIPAEERQGGDIQVLPPGPRDDATPEDIVHGFFGAQSSPSDAHASARAFLAPALQKTWRDNGPVSVFGSNLSVVGQANTFRVTAPKIGEINTDGSYNPARGKIDIRVELRRGLHGRWQITSVPDGLVLSPTDRDRSFRVRNIYYLAPPAAPGSASSHLVPDQVFLPVTAASADALVRRLLARPSRPLGDSVSTAFPTGTGVRRVQTDPTGLVTVDLTGQLSRAPARLREQMSAQLVWTLRGTAEFSKLLLLSSGRPVDPSSNGSDRVIRDASDWQPYDPDGLVANAPLYYIGGRRLRFLEAPTGPVSDASRQQVVDDGAASPRGGSLAFITRIRGGSELLTGPARGPFVLRARARSLSFPSWGSGEQGVWFVQNGLVKLAPPSGPPRSVAVDGLGGAGPISGLRVSRDGARIAVIAGLGTQRHLLVGRIAERTGALRVVGLRSVAPGVTDVSDLSWESGTSLLVLGRLSGVTAPVRVSVDGSSVALVPRVGLENREPLTIAAAPGDRPLVIGVLDGGAPTLLRDNGVQYVKEPGIVGGRPFYPG